MESLTELMSSCFKFNSPLSQKFKLYTCTAIFQIDDRGVVMRGRRAGSGSADKTDRGKRYQNIDNILNSRTLAYFIKHYFGRFPYPRFQPSTHLNLPIRIRYSKHII